MNILFLAPDFPKPGSPIGGVFNQRSVAALKEIGEHVEVLVPRPYALPLLSSLVPRWKIYASTPAFEVRKGVAIHRPAYPQIPRIGGPLWVDAVAFLFSRAVAKQIYERRPFDVILSFDLIAAGGLAWRIGRELGVPASGWATGGDVRFPAESSYGRALRRTLQNLDIVFYQSGELLTRAADVLGIDANRMPRERHIILPRGIGSPPRLSRQTRGKVRTDLGISEEQVLVLSVGRIAREKGIFELVDAVLLAAAREPAIVCVVVGSNPAFDETRKVQQYLDQFPDIKHRIRLLPACSEEQVWEYLSSADIFAFTSHHEGMPNSLLEAMAMGVPSIAFAIPPVLEIDGGTGACVLVPAMNSTLFAEALVKLAGSLNSRVQIGKRGRQRVIDRFTARKSMAEVVRLFRGLLESRKLNSGNRWAV